MSHLPPEDNVCLLGKLCESQSSSSRKVSGGVRLYVGVFSADCTPEMSSRSLQWSQARNLCISSDFFSLSLSLSLTFVRLLLSSFPSASLSFFLSVSPGIENNLLEDWTGPQILIVSSMLQCVCVSPACPCKVVM